MLPEISVASAPPSLTFDQSDRGETVTAPAAAARVELNPSGQSALGFEGVYRSDKPDAVDPARTRIHNSSPMVFELTVPSTYVSANH